MTTRVGVLLVFIGRAGQADPGLRFGTVSWRSSPSASCNGESSYGLVTVHALTPS